jgi:K+-sensing histidine kinase KdpD
MRPSLKHWGSGWLASGVLVGLVTVVIKTLHPHGPSRGLAVLYILAVVAVAVRWGPAFAFTSSLLSALAFDYFFLGRYGDLELSSASDLEAFGAYLATAVMAGLVASRLRHRAEAAQRLAAEQESQRKIASLVARGASPADILAGSREELGRFAGIDIALLFQWDLSCRTRLADAVGVPAGAVAPAGEPSRSEPSALVRTVRFDEQTPADEFDQAFGPVGAAIRDLHLADGIGGPVLVGDRTWGFVVVAARNTRVPRSVERDVAAYTELLAAAIGNSEDRADLVASRRRIISAADETRRKIERDLSMCSCQTKSPHAAGPTVRAGVGDD